MKNFSILLLDDDEAFREGLRDFLILKGCKVQSSSLPSEALNLLESNQYDVLLLDLNMPEMDGLSVLKKVKQSHPDLEVIIITGQADLEHSVAALRAGASDFISKPFRSLDIEQALERTRKFADLNERLRRTEQNVSALTEELASFVGTQIVGKSASIQNVLTEMRKVSLADDTSVLIFGESGTGKELIARGIHVMSKRKHQYFHSVNCAAVPESLFESEFFGYQKGAFTGANDTLPGWFEISNKGTLFLDEISGMPLQLQSKLLRVLDQKSITKLGSHKEVQLNLRIITATNQDLQVMINEGKFRNDLYHRLATFKIYLPPLRERVEDIPMLTEHFITLFNKKMAGHINGIDDAAVAALMNYPFPGNVRELKNMIERAFILSDGKRIRRKDLVVPSLTGAAAVPDSSYTSLRLSDVEESTIKEAIKRSNNNKSRASELLGITRQALDRRIEKFGEQ